MISLSCTSLDSTLRMALASFYVSDTDWYSIGDFEFTWACGPPIDMKIGLSLCCTLMGRGRRRSDYALDEVRPFLSLIGNARFEPIYVAPSLRVGRVVARDGV